MGMYLIELDDLNAGGRANGFNELAIGLDPVIDSQFRNRLMEPEPKFSR
jgi:hypothetical protein